MPRAIALHFIARHLDRLTLGGQVRVVAQRQFVPAVVVGRLQAEGLEGLTQGFQVVDVDVRGSDQRAQFTQRGVLFVACLDLFGSGQLVTRFRFKNIGAGALTLAEQVLVLLELLFEGLFLRLCDVDLVLGKQRLGVERQHSNQQLLALATEGFIGKQRLGHAFAVGRVGLVVHQWLLQGEGRAIAVVVAIIGAIAAIFVQVGGLGVVAALVVVVRQLWQQAGTADGAVLQARIAFLDGAEEHRIITQRQLVDIEWPHGLNLCAHQQCDGGPEYGKLAHATGHPYSSVNAEPARSSSGLNK
ncbi:hypothetical protein D3C78_414410 [compost metagenome]